MKIQYGCQNGYHACTKTDKLAESFYYFRMYVLYLDIWFGIQEKNTIECIFITFNLRWLLTWLMRQLNEKKTLEYIYFIINHFGDKLLFCI